MINVDTRLLKQVNQDEFWLIMQIASRFGKDGSRQCWPSNRTLRKDTGWGLEKLQSVKKTLIEKKILQIVVQGSSKAGKMANVYFLDTEFISIYLPSSKMQPDTGESGTLPENQVGGIPENQVGGMPENQAPNVLAIEVLTNEQLCKVVFEKLIAVEMQHNGGRAVKLPKATEKRIRQVVRAKMEFSNAWPDKPIDKFISGCEYMFKFKFLEWYGTDQEKYLRPETLMSDNFIGYVETAIKYAGKPPTKQAVNGTTAQKIRPVTEKREIHN